MYNLFSTSTCAGIQIRNHLIFYVVQSNLPGLLDVKYVHWLLEVRPVKMDRPGPTQTHKGRHYMGRAWLGPHAKMSRENLARPFMGRGLGPGQSIASSPRLPKSQFSSPAMLPHRCHATSPSLVRTPHKATLRNGYEEIHLYK